MTNHWNTELALIHLGQECNGAVNTVSTAFVAIGEMIERCNKLERENAQLKKAQQRATPRSRNAWLG